MAHAVRGFSLLLVYSGGFSAVCLICHFNAPVRRFNVWGYPYTAEAPLVLWALLVALWRGVVPCSVACRLRCQLAAVLVLLLPCRRLSPAPAGRSRWPGPPAAASPFVALRKSRRKSLRESRESRWHSRSPLCESRWQSRCESRKCLRQSRSFYPKIIVVYKIPCIKAGFFLPTFPELTESRAKVARFRLILHQSRWLLCTSAGAVRESSPQSAAGSVSKPSPACPPCRNSSWHGSNRQGNSASRKPQVLRQKSAENPWLFL